MRFVNIVLTGTLVAMFLCNVFLSFRSTRLKIPLVGLFRLYPTYVPILLKKKLNLNISNGWSSKNRNLYFYLISWDQGMGKVGNTSLLVGG